MILGCCVTLLLVIHSSKMERTSANIVIECPQYLNGLVCHKVLARQRLFIRTLRTMYNDPNLTVACYLPDPMRGIVFVVITTYRSWCIHKLHNHILEHVDNVVSDISLEYPGVCMSVVSRSNQTRTEQVYASGMVNRRVVREHTNQFKMDINDFPVLK